MGLMMLNGFGRSLRHSCKEMLYQPTVTEIKFKSKVRPVEIYEAQAERVPLTVSRG